MFSPEEIEEISTLDGKSGRIVAFQPDHLLGAPLRPLDAPLVAENRQTLVERLPKGYSFTALVDGKVYAMFGLVPFWEGVYEAWLIPTSDLDEHKFKMHRTSLKFFEYTAKILRARRYQCYVNSQNFLAIRWIEMMVFKKEGEMRNFGHDGSNYQLYARIF
tara:strand:- start:4758 stop:5240 length:483 start_codon:yes stop_codon:yes gene_type:complete